MVSRSSLPAGVLAILGCIGTLIGRAEAQEYCVACSEPRAVYRCVIDGARPGGRQSLQMLCLVAMTREGGHNACSVRGGTVFECDGPVRRVPWAAYNVGPKGEAPGPAPAAARDPEEGPPRTVAEMLARANANTAEQLRQANETVKNQAQALGKGIDDAGKKTWRCLSSLFSRCGGE